MIARELAIIAGGITSATMIGACAAHAEPPPFPDLNSYASVNVHDYENKERSPGESNTRVDFLTPDGIRCSLKSSSAGCSGNNFPDIPPAPSPQHPGSGVIGVNTIDTVAGLSKINIIGPLDNSIQGQPIKTLPPFHSISVNGVICGVDDAGMTACKDPQGRGFILSPSWSGWLPRV